MHDLPNDNKCRRSDKGTGGELDERLAGSIRDVALAGNVRSNSTDACAVEDLGPKRNLRSGLIRSHCF
jgi:hypothetical protein